MSLEVKLSFVVLLVKQADNRVFKEKIDLMLRGERFLNRYYSFGWGERDGGI